eukprot:1267391-Amphidinium_carterae.1
MRRCSEDTEEPNLHSEILIRAQTVSKTKQPDQDVFWKVLATAIFEKSLDRSDQVTIRLEC